MATRLKRARLDARVSCRAWSECCSAAVTGKSARSRKANGKMIKLNGTIRAQAVTAPEADVTDEIAKADRHSAHFSNP